MASVHSHTLPTMSYTPVSDLHFALWPTAQLEPEQTSLVLHPYVSSPSSSVRSYFFPSRLHAAFHSASVHRRLPAAVHAALALFQSMSTHGLSPGALPAFPSPASWASNRSMQ